MTDEPSDSDAEVLLEWAERVVDAEDDLVLDEREAQLQNDMLAAIVEASLLRREIEEGRPDPSNPHLRRWITATLDHQIAQIEQLLHDLNPPEGDPR